MPHPWEPLLKSFLQNYTLLTIFWKYSHEILFHGDGENIFHKTFQLISYYLCVCNGKYMIARFDKFLEVCSRTTLESVLYRKIPQ